MSIHVYINQYPMNSRNKRRVNNKITVFSYYQVFETIKEETVEYNRKHI